MANRKHGHRSNGIKTTTHAAWCAMLARCRNPRHRFWSDYGGRGITVCERWRKFENFLADMGECPAGLTLDRIENNGNYEPNNCKWATRTEQQNNRRNTRYLTIDGVTKPLMEWARGAGIKDDTLRRRIVRGETGSDLLRPTQRLKCRHIPSPK